MNDAQLFNVFIRQYDGAISITMNVISNQFICCNLGRVITIYRISTIRLLSKLIDNIDSDENYEPKHYIICPNVLPRNSIKVYAPNAIPCRYTIRDESATMDKRRCSSKAPKILPNPITYSL